MEDSQDAINKVYKENTDFILIGLTGRTGSGCSTAAELLSSSTEMDLSGKSEIYKSENDRRKFEIVSRYIKENWTPFKTIKVTTVITAYILEMTFDRFKKCVSDILQSEESEGDNEALFSSHFDEEFKKEYNDLRTRVKKHPLSERKNSSQKRDEIIKLYIKGDIRNFGGEIQSILKKIHDCKNSDKKGYDPYIEFYQNIGDNIRSSGKASSKEFDSENIFMLAKSVNSLVKVIRDQDKENSRPTRIVIDAIRNPFEALFFKQRYASFYLISINTKEGRLKRLRKEGGLSDKQIETLDDKEYPSKLRNNEVFISQNIQKCIELSDIHIHNPDWSDTYRKELCSQLGWYMALILHPGLVPPTAVERNMQVAYTAKLNSGCISRQVGAVVSDSNYSLKAVGWNSTPSGQTPCVLRNARNLQKVHDGTSSRSDAIEFSEYEKNDEEFQKTFKEIYEKPFKKNKNNHLKGRNLSFCFKDIRNKIKDNKNQVHTRALHAEENAFLQIAKYGGQALNGGILFSTASPCELCAKKAYQLGISKIIYVDPYPGIAEDNIIKSGESDKRPEMILYRGALGRAYHKLYQPLMSYKDELQLLTDTEEAPKKTGCEALEEENKQLKEKIFKLETASKAFCSSINTCP
jgi:dCMP deaminase